MRRRHSARGITLLEALAVVLIVVIVLAVVALMGSRARPTGVRQMYDATQVRGIQQSFVIWAYQNKGIYPLPSLVDLKDATVADKGTAKDHTANIMSLMVYSGGISVELLISLAESNTGHIAQMDNYQFDAPKTAVDPANALWDPALSADFTSPKGGNISYGHVPPVEARLGIWKDTSDSATPIVGNRGPEVASISRAKDGKVVPKYVNPDTNTFLIHGSRRSWEGNIAYADGHLNFETRTDPDSVSYKDAAKKKWTVCLFFDEPDDAAGTNAFLGIFIKAGDTKADFKSIWD